MKRSSARARLGALCALVGAACAGPIDPRPEVGVPGEEDGTPRGIYLVVPGGDEPSDVEEALSLAGGAPTATRAPPRTARRSWAAARATWAWAPAWAAWRRCTGTARPSSAAW